MIVVEGDIINNLYEAYIWLKEAWMYEPYNILYEDYGQKDSKYYRECISIEPVDDCEDYLSGWVISSLNEFEKFINTH